MKMPSHEYTGLGWPKVAESASKGLHERAVCWQSQVFDRKSVLEQACDQLKKKVGGSERQTTFKLNQFTE